MTDPADDAPLVVAVTGTPGTGKTTATDRLAEQVEGTVGGEHVVDDEQSSVGNVDVVHLNRVIEDEDLHDDVDEQRDSVVVDLDALAEWVDEYVAGSDADVVVLDSHLAHHLAIADRVIVLRCRPDVLEARLESRGEPSAKAAENAESEALDVVLGEAVDAHGTNAVYEIDTTERDPSAVATDVASVLSGDRDPSAGTVNYIEYATELTDR